MIYLLDVNALVAFGVVHHEFHSRVVSWVQSSRSNNVASCSITELGFVRVLAQAQAYGFDVAQACTLLRRIKEAGGCRFTFIPDTHGVSRLPSWVRAPKQITDGHLCRLASANGAVLATLDENIPDSYVIPR
jgi:uncharacterized protein